MKQKQRHNGTVASTLLAVDQQRSVLRVRFNATQPVSLAYTPYGHRTLGNELLGFNGEYMDPVTGHYLLGNGHRDFNPVLMRFHSPDIFSPFGKGGANAYCYVEGDPVNFTDPTGSSLLGAVGRFLRIAKRVTTSSPAAKNIPSALKATPVKDGIAIEKTLHKITHKDLSRLNELYKHIKYKNIILTSDSSWRNINSISEFATSNIGRSGITSTSRSEIKDLIGRGRVDFRTEFARRKITRTNQRRNSGNETRNFLGVDNQS